MVRAWGVYAQFTDRQSSLYAGEYCNPDTCAFQVAESVPWYQGNLMKKIERTQTGLRIEKRMLKVMKGLAEHLDCSLAEVVEGMILHNFEGKSPFSEATLGKIAQLKQVYDLDLTAADAHRLSDHGENA